MANLNVTLNISSSDATSDAMAINHTDNLTITNPLINVAQVAVLHTTVTTLIASTISSVNYVYVRNTDATNFIEIKTDAGNDFGVLYPGQFAFFPLAASVGMELQSDTATCVLEYGYWTK
jgi:hypothetical protein